jgi:hypothetical protein
LDLAIDNIRRVAPQAQLFQVSARTGAGLDDWYRYLTQAMPETRLLEEAAKCGEVPSPYNFDKTVGFLDPSR